MIYKLYNCYDCVRLLEDAIGCRSVTHAVVGTKLCWKKAGCSLKLNGKNHARSLSGQLLVHMSGALEQDYPGASVQLGTLPPKTLRIKKFTTHPLFFLFSNVSALVLTSLYS